MTANPASQGRKIIKAEDRANLKSQQHQVRPHSEISFHSDAPKFVPSKGDSKIYSSGTIGLPASDLKRVKLNYEELKKYLIKESHSIAK